MIMSWVYTAMLAASLLAALLTGSGGTLSAAALEGAQKGVELALSMAGSVCLWSGVGRLMEAGGLTEMLTRLLGPLLRLIFPSTGEDRILAADLSANICANLLGLGNAATPMGIRAAKRMAQRAGDGNASDELCRLIVLNTASIQLIPSTVAAVRSGLGAARPFDILPAVWVTSLCSAGLGLSAAALIGRLCRHD